MFERYERLAQRRHHKAGVLSGGERRLLGPVAVAVSAAMLSLPVWVPCYWQLGRG